MLQLLDVVSWVFPVLAWWFQYWCYVYYTVLGDDDDVSTERLGEEDQRH